ncbi:MAG: hypothetical protein WA736_12210 [Candidatus Acidiferrum sp.]
MRTYFRALAKPIAPQHHDFLFVPNIKDATKDYLPAVQKTQANLKVEHGVDTELVCLPDEKLMQPKYVLSRNVDENRIKIQNVREEYGIATWADELLTEPEPGVTTFEGLYEILDRAPEEAEDSDRK